MNRSGTCRLQIAFLAAAFLLGSVSAEGAVLRVPVPFNSIQTALETAGDGDTVLVAPGSYSRRATVDRPVVLLGEPGDVRLAGFTGSRARVEGFIFDAALSPGSETLVGAGENLEIVSCRFVGPATGVDVAAGAAGVLLRDVVFSGQVQAVRAPSPAGETRIESVAFENCPFGITAGDTLACGEAAVPCTDDACPTLVLIGVTVTGGDRSVVCGPGIRLVASDCRFDESTLAVRGVGARLQIAATAFGGRDDASRALVLDAATGTVRDCAFDRFAVACDFGTDAACALPTSVTVGGSLAAGNTFLNNALNLRVRQNETIAADFNHWGSLDCSSVAAKIDGQSPGIITDSMFLFSVNCATPVERTAWGSIKVRFARETRR